MTLYLHKRSLHKGKIRTELNCHPAFKANKVVNEKLSVFFTESAQDTSNCFSENLDLYTNLKVSNYILEEV